ncbi:ABC transporter substrate-binding protein [Paenibacillus turpanensis]|uniref:ABC transporter substrate-binding protein n=1 Tax=Paenibacillus turpanensis TaxID=2689078 RepID=UPI00140E013C|nr:extracellular solute-binding protein [Paenibacillus turpanensis]
MSRPMIIVLLTVMLLSGCTRGAELVSPPQQAVVDFQSSPAALRVLSSFDKPVYLAEEFEKKYPGISVEWTVVKTLQNLLDSLASEPPFDLIAFDYMWSNEMSGYDIFEDLNGPPYHIGQYKEWFPGLNWDRLSTMQDKKVIIVPRDLPAELTFYRADILAEHGFPSDPEQLGEWMENPDNWLTMAKKLKKSDVAIVSRAIDPFVMASKGQGLFTENMTVSLTMEPFISLLHVSKQIQDLGLDSKATIWDEKGRESLRNGKLAMFTLGEWGMEMLRAWSPHNVHLWKTTRLPFGLYGIHGGYAYAIPTFSNHKSLAWEWIKYTTEMDTKYRESLATHSWYDKLPDTRLTPVDGRGYEIILRSLDLLLSSEKSPEEMAVELKSKVEVELYREIQYMKNAQNKGRPPEGAPPFLFDNEGGPGRPPLGADESSARK